MPGQVALLSAAEIPIPLKPELRHVTLLLILAPVKDPLRLKTNCVDKTCVLENGDHGKAGQTAGILGVLWEGSVTVGVVASGIAAGRRLGAAAHS